MSSVPNYYEFFCPVKIVSGEKALKGLPYEMDQLGANKAMVITDQGVVGAGLIDQVEAVFVDSGAEIGAVYDQTPPDSSAKVVGEVTKLYRDNGCDCLVAVGGGSCIDTAKGANIVISEGGDDLLKYQGAERVKIELQPFIVIPTTAGTGSEVTSAAVIADHDKGVKMSLTSYKLFPNVAMLDPKMTLTMPAKITAATGMDALTHAMEAYYCLQKNPVSDAFAVGAIELIVDNLVKAVKDGKDIEARLALANAALMAGMSFSNSLCGVAHGLAHATGGVARVPHGIANAIFLPIAIESNIDKRAEIIAEMAPLMGITAESGVPEQDAQAVADAVRELTAELGKLSGMPVTLKEAGVKEDQLPEIAKVCINDGTIAMNPEEVEYDDALAMLKKAYQ